MMIRARAPLRLGLAGGGTDVSPYRDRFGGEVVNVTLKQYAYASARRLDKPLIRFCAHDKNQHIVHPLSNRVRSSKDFVLYDGVFNRLLSLSKTMPFGIELGVHSETPEGSGLGGSSTIVVAMVKALATLLDIELSTYCLANLAFEIEREDCGILGGKQDHFSAAFGGLNHFVFKADGSTDVNELKADNSIIKEFESSILLYYTGSSRNSADVIADQQIRMKASDNNNNIDALHSLKLEAQNIRAALTIGSFRDLIETIRSGWDKKKRTSELISTNAIESAFSVAMNGGALAGKVSGAGGGGFMWFIVPPEKKNNVTAELQKLGGYVKEPYFTSFGAEAWRVS